MRYAVAVANAFAQKVSVCVVEAPTPLNACKGILFDLVQTEGDAIAKLETMDDIREFAEEYDILMSDPFEVDGGTIRVNPPIKRPDPAYLLSEGGDDMVIGESDFLIDGNPFRRQV